MHYTPDNWVIVKITRDGSQESIYKVLAGWYGGYCSGDSWRLNSGITKIEQDENTYTFYGSSGSVYVCYKGAERLSSNTFSVLANLQSVPGCAVDCISSEQLIEEFKNED